MDEALTVENPTTTGPTGLMKRISWPAVFAGVAVVLVLQLFFTLVGASIGAATIDPMQERNPLQGMGLGSALWLGLTTLISLYAGGWVAGRMAGIPRRLDGALHGILAWSVATLVTVYLLSTAVGGILSGTAGILGRGLSGLGQGAVQAGSELLQQGGQGVSLDSLKNEVTTLLRQTGRPELQPENIRRETSEAARDIARDPQAAEAEITGLVNRVFTPGKQGIDQADRDALVNVLMARSDMSRQEANATVDRWQQSLTQLNAQLNQAKVRAEEAARRGGQQAAAAVTRAAGLMALMLALGGIVSALGGMTAFRRETRDAMLRNEHHTMLGRPIETPS